MARKPMTFTGTNGNDLNLNGTTRNDIINGLRGDDIITGFAGDDNISGGEGFDTANFSGDVDSYQFEWRDGTLFVTGDDGRDKLVGVEAVAFASRAYSTTGPIPRTDTLTTDEDKSLVFAAAALLANDTDLSGLGMTVTGVSNPFGGTVQLVNGEITFQPTANFHGTASFDYTVTSANGVTSTGTVEVTVNSLNDDPTISASTPSSVTEDGTITSVVDLTLGDPDGTTPAYDTTGWTQFSATTWRKFGTYGSATLDTSANTLTYTLDNTDPDTEALNTGDARNDPFTVTVSDGSASASTTVNFPINGADDLPDEGPTFIAVTGSGTNPAPDGISRIESRTGISDSGGILTFMSFATNLIPGETDSNGFADIFVFDRSTNTLDNITFGGNAASSRSSVSDDGNFVVFQSDATNLAPGDEDEQFTQTDIFVYNRSTGQTENITAFADNASFTPTISGNGRYIVFTSYASNLAPDVDPNPSNPFPDNFVYDRVTGTFENITEPNASAGNFPVISDDGSIIAFQRAGHIFLHDRNTDATTDITPEAEFDCTEPVISGNGNTVAFVSGSTNLVPNEADSNNQYDVFLYNRSTGEMDNITLDFPELNNFGKSQPTISDDGRYVMFEVAPPFTGAHDIYLYDTAARTLTNFSQTGTAQSFDNAISGDGSSVGFVTFSTELTPVNYNGSPNVLVADL